MEPCLPWTGVYSVSLTEILSMVLMWSERELQWHWEYRFHRRRTGVEALLTRVTEPPVDGCGISR
jgi:hypothetical protein